MTRLPSLATRMGAGLAGAAIVLTATPAAPQVSTTEAATATTAALARFHRQQLTWKSCLLGPQDKVGEELERAGAQCADVTVPLDYADPGGRTITVAISRIRATDRAHRVGPLLLNGGGPGGQTLGDPPWVRPAMKEVGARYDVIGIDPRFVGRSTPLNCRWPTGSSFRGAGADRSGFERMTRFARDLAERCRRNAGDVLPYVTTRNTARDMDVVRAALGERRISYLGYSYGSYLGQVYATMFPGRIDRMVLDGVLDSGRYSPRLLRGTEDANRRALEHWASWAATRQDTYGLGRTRAEVLGLVDRVQKVAARRPLKVGGFQLDAHSVPFVISNGLSQDYDEPFAQLAAAVRDMRRAAEGRQVTPSPGFAELLNFLLTGADSHYGSVQTAVLCGDASAPRDPEVYWRDVQHSRAESPLFGPATNNITPCAFWDRPRERPTAVTGDFPALLVNSTGDPRTTYESATALRGKWPSSRLITLRGADQHAVYGVFGSTCTDTAVNAYLDTGRLPTRDITCERGRP